MESSNSAHHKYYYYSRVVQQQHQPLHTVDKSANPMNRGNFYENYYTSLDESPPSSSCTIKRDNSMMRRGYLSQDEQDDENSCYYEIATFNEKKPSSSAQTAAAAICASNRLYDDYTSLMSNENANTARSNDQRLVKFINMHHEKHKQVGPSSHANSSSNNISSSLNLMSESQSDQMASAAAHKYRMQEADYATIRKVGRVNHQYLHMKQQRRAVQLHTTMDSLEPNCSSSVSSSPITGINLTHSTSSVTSSPSSLPHFHVKSSHGLHHSIQSTSPSMFDSNLLTPLTPNTYLLKQRNNDSHRKQPPPAQPLVSVDAISSPVPVPFDNFEFFNKMNVTNKTVDSSSGSQCSSAHGSAANNVKSASTSYLLSKISTSLASLKSANTSHVTSPLSTTSNNLITKIFNRKSNANDSTDSELTVMLPHETSTSQIKKSVKTVKKSRASGVHSSSNILLAASNPSFSYSQLPQADTTTSSRRPFSKKRSQSTHNLEKAGPLPFCWTYNRIDDYWYCLNDQESADSPSILIKRKQFTPISSSSASSISTTSPISTGCKPAQDQQVKIRLDAVALKYLTLIELKYLKQVCYNKLRKQLDLCMKESQQPSLAKCKLAAIPKDESMQSIKVKNILTGGTAGVDGTGRSKSVDFRFFEEIKENYLFKRSGGSSGNDPSGSNGNKHGLVFGQTLYKCILNDIKNQTKSSSKKSLSSSKLPSSKILIASKNDINVLNSVINQNPNVDPGNDSMTKLAMDNLTSSSGSELDASVNKRNSVLFEALDLKSVPKAASSGNNKFLNFNRNGAQSSKHSRSRLPLSSIEETEKPSEQQTPAVSSSPSLVLTSNNQNLAIRSEGLVPNIVKQCCRYITEHGLDTVGIFRIESSKKRIKELRELFDSGKQVNLDASFNANDVACILKEYLRSLHEPLLTRELYSSFLATTKINDAKKRADAIRYLVCMLPVPNRDTLEMLLKLLDKVRQHSDVNRMDAFNLAMVFGPNLLKKHKLNNMPTSFKSGNASHTSTSSMHGSAIDKYNLIDDIDSVISATKYLIENQHLIFSIEPSLHNELIEVINNITPSETNSILNRKLLSKIGISVITGRTNSESRSDDISNSQQTTSDAPSVLITDQHSSGYNSSSSHSANSDHKLKNELSKPTSIEEYSSSVPSPYHSLNSDLNTVNTISSSSSSTSCSSSNLSPHQPEQPANSTSHVVLNVDFIDSNAGVVSKSNTMVKRASRTRLHKVTNTFNPIELRSTEVVTKPTQPTDSYNEMNSHVISSNSPNSSSSSSSEFCNKYQPSVSVEELRRKFSIMCKQNTSYQQHSRLPPSNNKSNTLLLMINNKENGGHKIKPAEDSAAGRFYSSTIVKKQTTERLSNPGGMMPAIHRANSTKAYYETKTTTTASTTCFNVFGEQETLV